jgi:hypothetical protein
MTSRARGETLVVRVLNCMWPPPAKCLEGEIGPAAFGREPRERHQINTHEGTDIMKKLALALDDLNV